jgi:tetratricopeptide (TPR) repeat protein
MKHITAHKKPILTSIGFLFFAINVAAQSDTIALKFLNEKDYPRAKQAVEALVADEPTAEHHFLKAIVYDSIAKSLIADGLLPDARWQSFLALQQAALLKNEYVSANGKGLASDLRNGFLANGMAMFNSAVDRRSKTGFETALGIFKNANSVNEFICKYAWGCEALFDTINTLSAKSAIYADKEEDALIFSKKIVDKIDNFNNIVNVEDLYKWLVYYHSSKKDATQFERYLQEAKALYPQNNYFVLTEIDWLRSSKQYAKLLELYFGLIAKEPNNPQYKLAYCNDVFNALWPTRKPGVTQTSADLITSLKTLRKNNSTALKANFLLAKTYTNIALDSASQPISIINKKNFLQLSNRILQSIINTKQYQNKPEWREAKLLIKINNKLIQRI